MDKQRLLHIVKKAWGAYSQVPLKLSSDNMNASIASQLNWCICAGIKPHHSSLLLGIDLDTAQELAVSMLDLNSVSEQEIEDAVTEVVNVISGNVITDFQLQGRLSLPARVDSKLFSQRYNSLPITDDLLLSANERPFYIAIIQENPLICLMEGS